MFEGLEIGVSAAVLELKHPATGEAMVDEEGKTAFLKIWSVDSEKGKAAERAMLDRRIDVKRRKMTAADIEEENAQLLASLVEGWQLVSLAGKALNTPFTKAAAVKLFSTPSLAWIREQAVAFANDRGNFI